MIKIRFRNNNAEYVWRKLFVRCGECKQLEYSEKIEIIEKAKNLEEKKRNLNSVIDSLKNKLDAKENEQPPQPPIKKVISEPQMPPIETKIKFNFLIAFIPCIILFILLDLFENILLSICWVIVYYFLLYKLPQKIATKKIIESNEYKSKCQAVKEQFKCIVEEENQRFDEQMHIYNTQILPDFENSKSKMIAELHNEISQLESEIDAIEKELIEFYNSVRCIPEKYRTVDVLNYMYSIITKSDIEFETLLQWCDEFTQRKSENYENPQQQNSGSGTGLALLAVGAVVAGAVMSNSNNNNKQAQRELKTEKDRIKAEKEKTYIKEAIERERHEKKRKHNYMRSQIIKLNQERRRKGLPELPVPPGDWS